MTITTTAAEISSNLLLSEEIGRLHDLELIVEKGRAAFLQVANALGEIQERRLYREHHKTFEEYLLDRWGISRAYGYQIIAAGEVVTNLSAIADIPLPTNEAQTRPLTALEPDQQREAWQAATTAAAAEGQPVAARHVQAAVKQVKPERQQKCRRCKEPAVVLFGGEQLCQKCSQADQVAKSNVAGFMDDVPVLTMEEAQERAKLMLAHSQAMDRGEVPRPVNEEAIIVRPGDNAGVTYAADGAIYAGDWCDTCKKHSVGHKGCILCKGQGVEGTQREKHEEAVDALQAAGHFEVVSMACTNDIHAMVDQLTQPSELRDDEQPDAGEIWTFLVKHSEIDGPLGIVRPGSYQNIALDSLQAFVAHQQLREERIAELEAENRELTLLLGFERQGTAKLNRILQETVTHAESLAYQLQRAQAQKGHTVKPSDWKRLTALASRPKVNLSPDDMLSLLIQRQCDIAGIEIEEGE